MIERWLRFGTQIKTAVLTKWYWAALAYGLMAAALLATWLLLDQGSVAFVYSEF